MVARERERIAEMVQERERERRESSSQIYSPKTISCTHTHRDTHTRNDMYTCRDTDRAADAAFPDADAREKLSEHRVYSSSSAFTHTQ